jgi:hypothetical protein
MLTEWRAAAAPDLSSLPGRRSVTIPGTWARVWRGLHRAIKTYGEWRHLAARDPWLLRFVCLKRVHTIATKSQVACALELIRSKHNWEVQGLCGPRNPPRTTGRIEHVGMPKSGSAPH